MANKALGIAHDQVDLVTVSAQHEAQKLMQKEEDTESYGANQPRPPLPVSATKRTTSFRAWSFVCGVVVGIIVSVITAIYSLPLLPVGQTSAPFDLGNYQAAPVLDVRRLYNICPSEAQQRVTIWGDRFSTACNKDIAFGLPGTNGGPVVDIAGVFAYSLWDCMNACSGLNNRAARFGFPTTCHAISWNTDMRVAISTQHANCWLKNGTLEDKNSALTDSNVMSAYIL